MVPRGPRFHLCLPILALILVSCMDQYNPRPQWAQFEKERGFAERPAMKLTETGEMPTEEAAGEQATASSPIDQKYQTFCSSCHGAQGGGDGPGGMALTPRPRNFTDAAWQAEVTDDHIRKVIAEGGPAVGLSPLMAPWAGALSDDEIDQMVEKIRSFGK